MQVRIAPRLSLVLAATLLWTMPSACAETATAGRLLVQKIHAASLAETVTGEDPERTVAVYLPPTYDTAADKRYPVLFVLHGIGGTHADWAPSPNTPWGTLEALMNAGIAAGRLQEMIVVMPDQRTQAGGSFYTNSAVTGRWEDFTAQELVEWVDSNFRTLPDASSRGVAGHSMGGYGALTLGMKHPDVFGVVYAMNPAVLGWAEDFSAANPAFGSVLERTHPGEFQSLYEAAVVCVAQAFSPNPDRGPFYADFPFRPEAGGLVPTETARSWEERFPVLTAPRYRENLMKLAGLRFDSGTEDQFAHIPATSRQLSRVLTDLGVPHIFEEYNGDHRNRLWGRTGRLYTEVLPWFSLLLDPGP